MRTYKDIEYKEGLALDIYLPDCDNFDLFVYFHGGGLCSGTKDLSGVTTEALTARNIAIASIEYRMYPEAKFPDFIEDCAAAVRWLKDNVKKWGECRRIFAGGSSAGGYISMMLCFDKRYLSAVGMRPEDIAGYIHDAGQPTSHFNVLKELGRDCRRVIVDETAPIFFVGLEDSYPPMRFIVSDDDMFARYEQTVLMIKTLEHFGHKNNVSLTVMPGTHNNYVGKPDFAEIIISFIEGQS